LIDRNTPRKSSHLPKQGLPHKISHLTQIIHFNDIWIEELPSFVADRLQACKFGGRCPGRSIAWYFHPSDYTQINAHCQITDLWLKAQKASFRNLSFYQPELGIRISLYRPVKSDITGWPDHNDTNALWTIRRSEDSFCDAEVTLICLERLSSATHTNSPDPREAGHTNDVFPVRTSAG
jgi:hypothetical protein